MIMGDVLVMSRVLPNLIAESLARKAENSHKAENPHILKVRAKGKNVVCTNSLYPISTLPEHLHSTILRTPKLPENTHTPKETLFPSLFNARYPVS